MTCGPIKPKSNGCFYIRSDDYMKFIQLDTDHHFVGW